MITTLAFIGTVLAAADVEAPSPPVLTALQAELDRATGPGGGLVSEDGQRPYYLGYEVEEVRETHIDAGWGSIVHDTKNQSRILDIDLRVGDYALDSTHELRGAYGGVRDGGRPGFLPKEDDLVALRQVVWSETDQRFKAAVERLSRVKANVALKAEAQDTSADFSKEKPVVDVRPLADVSIDHDAWAERIRKASRVFLESPQVYDALVSVDANATNHYLASSEGTRITYGQTFLRVGIYAATRSDDGLDLFRYESWEGSSEASLPSEETLVASARKVLADLEALRKAPAIEPYTGPAILSGRAAAVFFHEIFGHRIEGHRQKSEDEGQTFTKRVNQPVLPPFLSVVDDPTMARFGDVELNGAYPYDNEGVKAVPVPVVEKGVLRSFLMSRSPIASFAESNGHGRRQPGYPPVGRQGNLIVKADTGLTDAELRQRLRDLIKKQGKPYGLFFEDISGGFTFTQRDALQAYKVLPIMVYRVYPDGRPDELVRGVDIVGTPLASFGKIVAAGDDVQVFNGYCGAESGFIPVSAVAPSILVSELEIEKRAKGTDRPPILEAPTIEGEKQEPAR
ncbi:MAG: metallopeptidase TldD-related protein [Acidobacteriota bacterium]